MASSSGGGGGSGNSSSKSSKKTKEGSGSNQPKQELTVTTNDDCVVRVTGTDPGLVKTINQLLANQIGNKQIKMLSVDSAATSAKQKKDTLSVYLVREDCCDGRRPDNSGKKSRVKSGKRPRAKSMPNLQRTTPGSSASSKHRSQSVYKFFRRKLSETSSSVPKPTPPAVKPEIREYGSGSSSYHTAPSSSQWELVQSEMENVKLASPLVDQSTGGGGGSSGGGGLEIQESWRQLATDHNYEMTRFLGRGSTALVYEGWRSVAREPKKHVALKFIPNAWVLNQAMIEAEAEMSRFLVHRFILETFDVLNGEDFTLLAHEYAEYDLCDYVDQYVDIPVETKKFWMAQMADALAHMHRNGVAHLDIKLNNIFLVASAPGTGRSSLIAKLYDFGLAVMTPQTQLYLAMQRKPRDPDRIDRILGELRGGGNTIGIRFMVNRWCGTPFYMAPEVLSLPDDGHSQYDAYKADIFSMGVTFHYMLFDDHPYDIGDPYPANKSVVERCAQVIRKRRWATKNPTHWAQVDRRLAPLLLKMLDPVPEERIPAEQLLLEDYFRTDNRVQRMLRETPNTGRTVVILETAIPELISTAQVIVAKAPAAPGGGAGGGTQVVANEPVVVAKKRKNHICIVCDCKK